MTFLPPNQQRQSTEVITSYLLYFNLPNLHLAPPLGVTLFKFCPDLWRQKTRVPGRLCGIVSMILRLVISMQYWHVSDRQTHDYSIYCTSVASHGRNKTHSLLHVEMIKHVSSSDEDTF